MRTEFGAPGRWMNAVRCGRLFAVLLAATILPPTCAWAQRAVSRSADETIDVALNAIEGPVLQPFTVPPGGRRGIPPFPPYKQEPPAAQRDFRALTSPTSVPPPNSGKSPGGPPSGQPGTATGSASGGPGSPGPGGKPPTQPGQFPPPNIDPTPPDILPPPGPGLPPPGPFLRPRPR